MHTKGSPAPKKKRGHPVGTKRGVTARERGPKTRLGCRHAASTAASPRRAQQARIRACWARTGAPCRAVRTLPIPCHTHSAVLLYFQHPGPWSQRLRRARACRVLFAEMPRCCQGLRPCWPSAQRESRASRDRLRTLRNTRGRQFRRPCTHARTARPDALALAQSSSEGRICGLSRRTAGGRAE